MSQAPESVAIYWPNGLKKYEVPIVNGLPHGTLRTWYDNGMVEREIEYISGNINGSWKVWSMSGDFVGHFVFNNDHENYVSFRDDGMIDAICEYADGRSHGRSVLASDRKSLEWEYFYIYGREVTRKQYIKACEFDKSLPPYEGDPDKESEQDLMSRKEVQEWKDRQKTLRESGELPKKDRADLLEPVESDTIREALAWLNEPSDIPRLLHKRYYTDECVLIIEEGYAAGCKKIWAVDIETNEWESNARRLLVEVPADGKQRESALDWVVRMINGNMGFPPDDRGQTFFVIGLC